MGRCVVKQPVRERATENRIPAERAVAERAEAARSECANRVAEEGTAGTPAALEQEPAEAATVGGKKLPWETEGPMGAGADDTIEGTREGPTREAVDGGSSLQIGPLLSIDEDEELSNSPTHAESAKKLWERNLRGAGQENMIETQIMTDPCTAPKIENTTHIENFARKEPALLPVQIEFGTINHAHTKNQMIKRQGRKKKSGSSNQHGTHFESGLCEVEEGTDEVYLRNCTKTAILKKVTRGSTARSGENNSTTSWLKDDAAEAREMITIGKKVGVSVRRSDEEIVKYFVGLESRDKANYDSLDGQACRVSNPVP